jgi:hypothetical protein
LVSGILAERRPVPHPQQQMADLVLRLRNLHLEREMASIRHRLSEPALGETENARLVQRLTELRTAKNQPLAPRTPQAGP